MTQTIKDKTKQYYLDKLELVNARAFNFYLINRKKGFSNYEIKKKVWSSLLWHEARILFMELNIFIYGKLTCEICHKGFYVEDLTSFHLHHDILLYKWDKVFNPITTHLVHKGCHKKELYR